MACCKVFLASILLVISSNLVLCAEFVPVYMWGTGKLSEHAPALHKTSEDSFKDTLLEYLKKDPYVLVFAEHTLSPEDFAQRDQNGEIAFPNILNLKKDSHVTYKPYVQNPLVAIKQIDRPVTEISIKSLLDNPDVPKDDILIIDLNDAKDDEQRFTMLQRHDSDIVTIYKDIHNQHENILVIYTAYHTSWVTPEEVSYKKTRDLLQIDTEEKKPKFVVYNESNDDVRVIMYLKEAGTVDTDNMTEFLNDTTVSELKREKNVSILSLTGQGSSFTILFKFSIDNNRYWSVKSVNYQKDNTSVSYVIPSMYAPERFSYHCGNLTLKEKTGHNNLSLIGFQIQYYRSNSSDGFGDAYDCVGFTSVPIWSALFVTAILLLIMTFGLTMMMDIKTMDRFDDAKGKTITINASE